MNETIKTILDRHSIRAYKQEQIKQEELDLILKCAIHAPSSMNSQNWHFTVIQNKEFIQKLDDEACKNMPVEAKDRLTERNNGNSDISVFYKSPTVIMVSYVENNLQSATNCSFAIQNICLAAESLNIGSCIIGLVSFAFMGDKKDELLQEMKIPSGYAPLLAVSLGYKDMDGNVVERLGGKITLM